VVNGATLTEDRNGGVNAAYSVNSAANNFIQMELPLANSFTVCGWYKCTIPDRYYPRIFFYGDFSSQNAPSTHLAAGIMGNEPSWIANYTGKFFNETNVSGSMIYHDVITADNTWHHFAVSIATNAVITTYIDGAFAMSNNIANALGISNGQFFLGRDPIDNYGGFGQGRYNGLIDDIAFYNRALTPQEIQNLFTGTSETLDTGDGAAPLPQGIPYQAAARDAQGQVIADAPVNVRFSLHEGAVDGAVSYSETHALTTNGIGLFNTVFGNGTPEQSAFDSINWAATTKFLQVEIDLGDGYVDMGTTQLLSVPYAFRSDEAARIKNAGLPIFADNAAALAGGLVAGEMYRTASGDLKVAY
jgi:hypothetical protein